MSHHQQNNTPPRNGLVGEMQGGNGHAEPQGCQTARSGKSLLRTHPCFSQIVDMYHAQRITQNVSKHLAVIGTARPALGQCRTRREPCK
jgi:hypothetical protein